MLDNAKTLAGDPIRAPGNPSHLMWVKPFARMVTVKRKGQVLAETINPLRICELGRDLYAPVIYIPTDDISADLDRTEKRTFCPLKGHADYYDLIGPGGAAVANDIAWAYNDTLDSAAVLKRHIAFDAAQVEITEAPI